jgi:glycosyltransferase involved in cell wall biosynthesis
MPVVVRKRVRGGVLFVHNNFPGQLGFLAEKLRRDGIPCASISSTDGAALPGIPAIKWRAARGTSDEIYPPATRAEADMLRGRAAADAATALKKRGFTPALIIGHPGWGETLFLKEVFPRAKQIAYSEYYYHPVGADSGFDPEFEASGLDERLRIRGKNATLAMAYADADRLVAPTAFQAGLLPPAFQARTTIIHEGVDTDLVRNRPAAVLRLGNGRILDRSRPVITFINRCFEPLRGYHIFMRALPRVLERVPDAEAVLIGDGGERGYGIPAPRGTTWKDIFLEETGGRLDRSRVHFVGRLSRPDMLDALSISSAHVYYTYPFVLSWSVLEAMAAECLVIGSDTAPVREVIADGANGILLDFFDHEALADTLIRACTERGSFKGTRAAARRTVLDRYDRKRQSEPAWQRLIDEVTGWREARDDAHPSPALELASRPE